MLHSMQYESGKLIRVDQSVYTCFRYVLRGAGILLALLTTISCSRSDLPTVPEFKALGFGDAQQPVHQQMITVYNKWRDNPLDAERNGRLGMHLSVYGKNRAAVTLYRRARILAPEDFRWTYYLAFSLREMGHYDQATVMFREALKIDPGHAEARLQLADLLLQGNHPRESLKLYQSISEEFPGRIEGWYGLGRTYARLNDYDSAIATLRRARLMGPEYGEIRYALALALRAKGDRDEAELEFAGYERTANNKIQMADPLLRAVSALHAGDEPHLERANEILRNAQVNLQFEKAARSFRAALAINPANQEAWIGLVSAQAALGDREATEKVYREALAAGIRYSRLHLTYGQNLLNWQQIDSARDVIGRAIALDPQFAEAFTAMGELELQTGSPGAAVSQFRLSLAARPNDQQVRLLLAQALNAAGQFSEAADQLDLLTDPDLDKSLILQERAVADKGTELMSAP